MQIDKQFEGGNIQVLSLTDDRAELAVELRDTIGDWFYWAFRVTGAAGRTVTFTFQDGQRVGFWGAAVSHDLIRWQWTNTASEDYKSFTYVFGPEENEVYFCHDMRYSTGQFTALCAELGLEIKTLTISERGRPVPYVEFGSGSKAILFTSRHHACESTGTYLMEGVLRTLVGNVPEGFKVIAIPFADFDGVVDGDQGKNRNSRDHSLDYGGDSTYASTCAIKQLVKDQNVLYFIDMHSPWHFGGWHDLVFIMHKQVLAEERVRFAKLLTERNRQHPDAMHYDTANDLPFGKEWNTKNTVCSATGWFAVQPGAKLSVCIETTYFGLKDNIVSQPKLIELGVCVAQTVCDYIAEQD